MGTVSEIVLSVVTASAGVALAATALSKNSNTQGIITAGSQGYAGILQVALSPVTGNGGGGLSFSTNGY